MHVCLIAYVAGRPGQRKNFRTLCLQVCKLRGSEAGELLGGHQYPRQKRLDPANLPVRELVIRYALCLRGPFDGIFRLVGVNRDVAELLQRVRFSREIPDLPRQFQGQMDVLGRLGQTTHVAQCRAPAC